MHLLDIDEETLASNAAEIGAAYGAVDLGDAAVARQFEHRSGTRVYRYSSECCGWRAGTGRSPISEVTEEDWRNVFAANVDAAFWLAQAIGPGMVARGRGRMVFVASGAGLRPSRTGIQAYTAAKHALVGLTKQLSWNWVLQA